MVKAKVTSVKLWDENREKMEATIKETGMTQSDFINSAIANAVVIGIAESKEIARGFIRLRDAMGNGQLDANGMKEVERVCRSLDFLTEEIVTFQGLRND